MKILDILWGAPYALEFVPRLFLLTSSLTVVSRVLHDIPRGGRARTLSRDIAHASRNEQLQAARQAAVRSVKYEEREVEYKHSTDRSAS